jgi:hypothetical protein
MKALYVVSSSSMAIASPKQTHDSGGSSGRPKIDRLRA